MVYGCSGFPFSVIHPLGMPMIRLPSVCVLLDVFVLTDKLRHFLCVKITSANLDIRPHCRGKGGKKNP